jgi:hypothetical protein
MFWADPKNPCLFSCQGMSGIPVSTDPSSVEIIPHYIAKSQSLTWRKYQSCDKMRRSHGAHVWGHCPSLVKLRLSRAKSLQRSALAAPCSLRPGTTLPRGPVSLLFCACIGFSGNPYRLLSPRSDMQAWCRGTRDTWPSGTFLAGTRG